MESNLNVFMTAILDLTAEVQTKLNIESMVKDIAATLDRDIKSMSRRGCKFSEELLFTGGFDLTGQAMAKLGLIRTQRSAFDPGSYSYTLRANDLYLRLREERYYNSKSQ